MDRNQEQKKIFERRHWLPSPYGRRRGHILKDDWMVFSVMSYSILSQQALQAHPHLYDSCEASHLNWEYRAAHLLDDLYFHLPEIICLQEIEEDDFQKVFLGGLKKKGYDGVFKKRTGDEIDGCAIFFKTKNFNLIETIPIEFHKEEVPLLNRENIALICILKPTAPDFSDKKVFVANTHLLFDPERADVRLSQLRILLAELEKRAFQSMDRNGDVAYHPIVVCGNFNFTPSSLLYDFLACGEVTVPERFSPIDAINIDLHTKYTDSESIRPSTCPTALNASQTIHPEPSTGSDSSLSGSDEETEILSHSLKLLSAYGDITSQDELMTATTYNSSVNDKVDYIFFSVDDIRYMEREGRRVPQIKDLGDLVPLQCFKLLKKQDMDAMHALPNEYFSSDHTYLVAKFKFI